METSTRKVDDSVAKVDNELAVGEDIQFQRRWWVFERWVWRFFALIVLADLLGAFGRGPLANASKTTPDGVLSTHYERIERFSTPSILKINLGQAAVHGGAVHLWIGNSLMTRLGNQRVIPQPASSKTTRDGVIYTFPSADASSQVEFALQPANLGRSQIAIRVLDGDSVDQAPRESLSLGIFVMP